MTATTETCFAGLSGKLIQASSVLKSRMPKRRSSFFASATFFPILFFMDINMPRINGYECVQEIHGFPNLKNTQIIMYSSSFNPRDQVEFGVLGLKYLSKTSDIHELVDSIKKMIQSN